MSRNRIIVNCANTEWDLHVFSMKLKRKNEQKNCGHKAHWINWTQRSITLSFNKYMNKHTRELGKKREEKRDFAIPQRSIRHVSTKQKVQQHHRHRHRRWQQQTAQKHTQKSHPNRLTSFNSNDWGKKSATLGAFNRTYDEMQKCAHIELSARLAFFLWLASSLLVCSFKVFVWLAISVLWIFDNACQSRCYTHIIKKKKKIVE